MGIKLLETIKKVFSTTEAKPAMSVPDNFEKKYIPMVDEKRVQEESNQDKVEIKNSNKRSELYKRLENFCGEYRISPVALKQLNFLEEIVGTEKLEELSDEELNLLFLSLDKAMKRDWKAFWKDRDHNDIREIITDTRHQFNRDKLNKYSHFKQRASWLGQKFNDFMTEKTLMEELVAEKIISKDVDINSLSEAELRAKVREYVRKEYLGDMKNYSHDKIRRRYRKAEKRLIYFANKYESDKEKSALSGAVGELASNSMGLVSKILIDSCGSNEKAKAKVAYNLFKEIDTAKIDALGEYLSKDSATNFYDMTFRNMNKEDAISATQEMRKNSNSFMSDPNRQEQIEKLKQRQAKGDTLSPEELAILLTYENKIVAQNAGATVGLPQNRNFTTQEATSLVKDILNDAKKLGFDNDVLETVSDYIDANPQKFSNMSKEDFVEFLNEATDNKFSTIQADKKAKKAKVKTETTVKKADRDYSKKEINDNIEVKEELKENSNVTAKDEQILGNKASITNSVLFVSKKSSPQKRTKIAESISDIPVETQDLSDKNVTKPEIEVVNDFEKCVKKEGKIKGYKIYKEEFGEQEAITEAFVNWDNANKSQVKKDFQRQDSTTQFHIIERCGTKIDKPLEFAKDSTILKLEGKILSCTDATKKAKNAIEELRQEKTG